MARSDREIVESIYERWNRDDGDLALDLFAEDAEIHQNPTLLDTPDTSAAIRAIQAAGDGEPQPWTRAE